MVRFSLFIFTLSLLAHGSFAGWVRRSFPAVPARLAYGVALALSVWSVASRVLVKTYPSPFFAQLFAITMVETSVLALAAIPLLLLRGGLGVSGLLLKNRAPEETTNDEKKQPDAATLPSESAKAIEAEIAAPAIQEPAPATSRRAFIERAGGAALYGTTASLFGWGMVRGRHAFQIDELVVRVANLPKALDGYTLAQISDIHVGTFIQERELQEGFELVRKIKPDALVMTGDLVDSDANYAALLASQLHTLNIRDGIYGILGNHDHFSGGAQVRETLSRAGIRMLVNEHHVLRAKEGGIALVGLDDLTGQRFGGEGYLLEKALNKLNPELPRVVLSHQPSSIEWLWGKPSLQLSGHTHGGQIAPGGINVGRLAHQYIKGRYQVGDMTLYVNRGFGTAGPPARIGAPPEITKVVLVAG